jgi:hypothetical protein
MPLQIENTHAWSDPARIGRMWPSILANLRKFIAQFPDDVTEEFLINSIIEGKRHLWVIYDEASPDVAVMVILTEIKCNDATGKHFIEAAGLGGNRMKECLPLIEQIEQWAADEHDASESLLIGRMGWRRVMGDFGYRESAVIMKKPIGDNNGQSTEFTRAG